MWLRSKHYFYHFNILRNIDVFQNSENVTQILKNFVSEILRDTRKIWQNTKIKIREYLSKNENENDCTHHDIRNSNVVSFLTLFDANDLSFLRRRRFLQNP